MNRMPRMTSKYKATMQRNIDLWGEHVKYLLKNPAEQERLAGATIVFDEESFERVKARNDGSRVVLVQKTYRHTYA